MSRNVIKSKAFAVPQYPSARGYPTQTLLAMQTRRATGRAALVGLALAAVLVIVVLMYGG